MKMKRRSAEGARDRMKREKDIKAEKETQEEHASFEAEKKTRNGDPGRGEGSLTAFRDNLTLGEDLSEQADEATSALGPKA